MEVIKLGDMDNSDGSFDCCNRVYSSKGLSPTISAHNGDIKILHKTNVIRNRKQMLLGTENTIFDYGREKDIERLENATDGNHSAKLNKMPNGHLDSIDSAEICDIDHPLASTTRRGRVQEGGEVAPTLTVSGELHRIESLYRIRKLTPKECVRLMAFDDSDYYKMKESGMTDASIYHCCGDSICVNVLQAIFSQLFNGIDYKAMINERLGKFRNERI